MKSLMVGQIIEHETLGECEIIAIHAANTIDVYSRTKDRYFRISGLC